MKIGECNLGNMSSQYNAVKSAYNNSLLKPEYTFETFVVGNSNRFAYLAALAVAEEPVTSYNPLFIYGSSGVGKTHLLHAIGNEIVRRNSNSNILYITTEKLTNQLIKAIKNDTMNQFYSAYCNVDILLIDDIQFISGKERIQEELLHIIKTLHEKKKQIVLSSNCPLKDIQLLKDGLIKWFDWGINADISEISYETKLEILKRKKQLHNISIDDEVLSTIATKVSSDVRELEGALNKIIAEATLTMEIPKK